MHTVERIDVRNGGVQEIPTTIPGIEQLVHGFSRTNPFSDLGKLLDELITRMPADVERLVSLHDGVLRRLCSVDLFSRFVSVYWARNGDLLIACSRDHLLTRYHYLREA